MLSRSVSVDPIAHEAVSLARAQGLWKFEEAHGRAPHPNSDADAEEVSRQSSHSTTKKLMLAILRRPSPLTA